MWRNGVLAVQGLGIVNNTCDFWENRCLSACLMPPKGSGTKLSEEGNGADEKSIILTLTSPADFIVDLDCTKVGCKVCSAGIPSEHRVRIGVRSVAKHLQSMEHFEVVERLENAKRQQERLEDERTSHLRMNTLTAPFQAVLRVLAYPVQEGSRYMNVHHAQLQKQSEVFGLLDAEGVAKALGFGGDDVVNELLAEDKEEDFLSGIMANITESNLDGGPDLENNANTKSQCGRLRVARVVSISNKDGGAIFGCWILDS
ncbi:hypothetical protein B0H14DRAFT_2591687 [Mycena olivaceomarginata]|nr:hypothetical protein B0H14DRAFT_2591687 [Mycena olivaceomarginata]